jgi:membrane-bound lytic murein transglycosylase B
VPSVFADLVQADRPEIIKDLRKRGAFRFSKHPKARDLRKIAARAAKKSKWAIGELKDLEKIYHARGDNSVFELRGSYAGAFGMSQFLPSSYRRMTVKSPTLRALNLDHADDAIRSVAIYLHDNGWREKITRTHVKALMNYNDSRDYADSILKLAADVAGVKTQASDRRHIPRTKKQRDIANEH